MAIGLTNGVATFTWFSFKKSIMSVSPVKKSGRTDEVTVRRGFTAMDK